MKLHFIPPGLYCVPAALYAITGNDIESVIFPALNRAAGSDWQQMPVGAASMASAARALVEMGWNVRPYKHSLIQKLFTWGEWSRSKYPGRILLLATGDHALVALDGLLHDTLCPHGIPAWQHEDAHCRVIWAAIVEQRHD